MFISLCRSCGTPAAALMSFTYADAELRLADLAATPGDLDGVPLCSSHADRKTAPVGWSLVDSRRSNDRHLFIPLPADVA